MNFTCHVPRCAVLLTLIVGISAAGWAGCPAPGAACPLGGLPSECGVSWKLLHCRWCGERVREYLLDRGNKKAAGCPSRGDGQFLPIIDSQVVY